MSSLSSSASIRRRIFFAVVSSATSTVVFGTIVSSAFSTVNPAASTASRTADRDSVAVDEDDAAPVELPRNGARRAEVAVMLRKGRADVGRGAIPVVRQRLHE